MRLATFLVLLTTAVHAQSTLAKVRHSEVLSCGVVREDAEYNTEDDHGSRGSFDDDLCKALGAATLGEHAVVKTISFLDDLTAMAALRDGKIDVIASVSSDFRHNTMTGTTLSRPVFYDAVGLLVPKASGVTHASQLAKKKICFLAQTDVENTLQRWRMTDHVDFLPFPFQEEGEMEAAYATNNCTALAGDTTRLANTREEFGATAKDYTLLPETLAYDPMASATRSDDPQWTGIVNWTIEVLLHAEDLGMTKANSVAANTADDSAIQRLIGSTQELGHPLGLSPDWAWTVVRSVGNYGEIFDQSLGKASVPRAANRLARNGGLMQPIPLK